MTQLGVLLGYDILTETAGPNPKETDSCIVYDGPPLRLKEIRDHLTHYTYKPGWSFTAEEVSEATFALWVHAWVKDARDIRAHLDTYNSEPFRASGEIELPYSITMDSLDRAIRWYIEYREIHELREWLKFDGDPVDYPPH